MSWLASITIGVLTALTAAIATGVVASLAVDWYNVPSREGASGYFVILFILLAIIIGFIVGMVAARVVAGRPDPGFLKALGVAQLGMLGSIGLIGGVARLLADVGPTLGGQPLLLNVEFRWPKGEKPPVPTEEWWLQLASVSHHVQRGAEKGPMWPEDAREEDGYWIVPGAVNVWTSRGDRIIDLKPDSILPTGYVIPLSAWPGRKYLKWSEWYPQQRKGAPPLPDEYRFRFRVVPGDQPIRIEKVGDFQVATIARSVGEVTYDGRPTTWTADASFRISYRGKPVVLEGKVEGDSTSRFELADGVAVLPGAEPALLVFVGGSYRGGNAWLIAPAGDSVRTEFIAYSSGWNAIPPLTNDTAVFATVANRASADGRIDNVAFHGANLYLFNGAVLDARTRTVHRLTGEEVYNLVDRVNPLGVSPDEKSYIRLGHDPDSSDISTFEVFSLAGAERYRLPVDQYQMRWGDYDDLSPLFVSHYFTWAKQADGGYRLTRKPNVKPLPYHGRIKVEPGYQEYRVYLAKASLRDSLVAFVAREFKGEPVPVEREYAYAHEVKVDGKVVNVSWGHDDGHVAVWMDRGIPEVVLVSRIGERFNAELATGKYDQDFDTVKPIPSYMQSPTE